MPRAIEGLRVAGVVLAAGASRRMGRNKMLLELEGEPLVRRAARRALEAGLSPVVVVLGHEAEQARAALAGLPVEFATNPDFQGPTSGSLHAGLARLAPDRVAAGDAAPLIVSRYGDVTAPPLLFRRALFAELMAWTGEGCGKAVVQAHRHEARYVDRPGAVLADVDTPEDFAAVQKSSS
jgi:molybdenum cofactor cytidylyltransferase